MNNCDCTSFCGDDPDLRTKSVHGCETHLNRTEPKRLLIAGLQKQAALMQANANYFEQLHPTLNHHEQLRRAAKKTLALVKKAQEAA